MNFEVSSTHSLTVSRVLQTENRVFIGYGIFSTLGVQRITFFMFASTRKDAHWQRIKIAVAIKVTSYFPWFTIARNAWSTDAVIYRCTCIPAPFFPMRTCPSIFSTLAPMYTYSALKIIYVLQRKQRLHFKRKPQIFTHVKKRNLEQREKENGHYLFSQDFSWPVIIKRLIESVHDNPCTFWFLVILRRSFFKYRKLGPARIWYDTSWSLFMHALRVTAVQRRKATYIMSQIVECYSSVTPKRSGPGNKKIFGTMKEPLIAIGFIHRTHLNRTLLY